MLTLSVIPVCEHVNVYVTTVVLCIPKYLCRVLTYIAFVALTEKRNAFISCDAKCQFNAVPVSLQSCLCSIYWRI